MAVVIEADIFESGTSHELYVKEQEEAREGEKREREMREMQQRNIFLSIAFSYIKKRA